MSFSDHVVHPESIRTPYPYTEDGQRRWATITKHLRFTNNIFVLPMRNPYLVAKSISTAAVISNNRIIPAIGVGWSKDEFELMRLLWSGEMVNYQGEYYQFDNMEMNPAPSEYMPMWVGGISEAAMKRAARLGDGWVTDLQTTDEIIQCVQQIQQYRKDYGRDHLPFDIMARLTISSKRSMAWSAMRKIL